MAKTVADVMTARPRCVTPDTPVSEVARIMSAEDVGSIPVIDEPGRLLAIVTDRDLALRVVGEERDPGTPVIEVATGEPITATPDQDLGDVLVVMASHQLRRVPVVADERVVGVLSQADIALGMRDKTVGDLVAEISRPLDGPRL